MKCSPRLKDKLTECKITRCLVCNRKLNDSESIRRKIGPACWRRLQRLTKEEKAKKKAKREANKRKAEMLKGQITMFEGEDNG